MPLLAESFWDFLEGKGRTVETLHVHLYNLTILSIVHL